MARPKPAETLEELAEKTGIEEELLENYALLSSSQSITITFMGFHFPTLFVPRPQKKQDPSRFHFKDSKDTQLNKYSPKVSRLMNGALPPDFIESLKEIESNRKKDIVFPLDERVDMISVMFNDYYECNSSNPKEWYIFRSNRMLDDSRMTWEVDQDKWRKFSKLKPRERAKILWLWTQYLNLSIANKNKSLGRKPERLHKIRILLILSELERIGTECRSFWAANFLNIVYNMPLRTGYKPDVNGIRDYTPRLYDLETRITRSGAEREERAGEGTLRSAWSSINKQIKPFKEIYPTQLSPKCVR